MRLIAEGKAPRITQTQEGATYECIQKKDNSKVAWESSSKQQNMSGLDVEGLDETVSLQDETELNSLTDRLEPACTSDTQLDQRK